jgi:hypothetical protein
VRERSHVARHPQPLSLRIRYQSLCEWPIQSESEIVGVGEPTSTFSDCRSKLWGAHWVRGRISTIRLTKSIVDLKGELRNLCLLLDELIECVAEPWELHKAQAIWRYEISDQRRPRVRNGQHMQETRGSNTLTHVSCGSCKFNSVNNIHFMRGLNEGSYLSYFRSEKLG